MPGINEERLIRARKCERLGVRYAVFGEHRFCPVCGPLPALTTALDALGAETARLDLLGDLPSDARRPLQESGVLDRTYADTVENIVGIVETIAARAYRELVPGADARLLGKGNVFQRLDDLTDLFLDAGGDLRASVDLSWAELRATWAARHVFTHRDGIVDDKYLRAVPNSGLTAGQRLRATHDLARAAIRDAEALCRAIAEPRA